MLQLRWGRLQARQLDFAQLRLAAHPVGTDTISAELQPSSAMVMLRAVMMTKVFLLPEEALQSLSDAGV